MNGQSTEVPINTENVDGRTLAFLKRQSDKLLKRFAYNMTAGPALATGVNILLSNAHLLNNSAIGANPVVYGIAEGIGLGLLNTAVSIKAMGKGEYIDEPKKQTVNETK